VSEANVVAQEQQGNVYSAVCPCRDLMDVVASKWAALAIGALAALRRLEDFGLIEREIYPEVPARVEYSLTDLGRGALGPVTAMREWAEGHYAHARECSERVESSLTAG
jgi:DNA-binding HxlR family transcriptional regulator